MRLARPRYGAIFLLALNLLLACGCGQQAQDEVELMVPSGFQPTLEVVKDGTLYTLGPFVGYYFRPVAGMERLELVCFNERGFYASDMPVNAELFRGDAVLTRLPDGASAPPGGDARIIPVFFSEAPQQWLATRPQPSEEFRHFHSLHNARGASLWGYWLRHRAKAGFTYDMGGRVGPDSPLFHQVRPGVDAAFAQIIEFDRGPG